VSLSRVAAGVLALTLGAAEVRAVEDPDTEIAKRHFAAGAALYDRGLYKDAIVEFSAARDVKPAPAFDFNIARCYDRLERTREAVEWYERYIATNPPEGGDGGARERLALLKTRVDKDRQRVRYSVAVPAVVGGAALAFWVAGGVLYGIAGSEFDSDKKDKGCGTKVICGSDVWGGTQTKERAGIGLMVTGGVLTAVDVALWAAWRRR
jgi:tetratricopeptide (TPR) repeat protein